jgi:DNA polymerase III delta prime subunit
VEFGIKPKDKPKLAAKFFERLKTILDQEKIEADDKVLAHLIQKHFPDWRRVLNECQRHSTSGRIDSEILSTFSDVRVNELIKHLREKNFTEVRKWIVSNMDNNPNTILRKVYDSLYEYLDGPSIAETVLIIAKYQYQSAFVADQEINLLAALTEIMAVGKFK